MIHRQFRCDCKLWNALWFYYIHFWRSLMSELLYLHHQLSLIVYLINIDVTKCQMWLQVMERLIVLRFKVFSYIIDDHWCLKCCILTKLLQIVGLTNTFILICWHVRWNYKLRKVLWFNCVLWKFQFLIRYILHQIFIHFVEKIIWYVEILPYM